MQKQKPSTVATTDLMRAFNFTPADLDANQHGYMTKEQRIKLRKRYQFSLRNIVRFLPSLALYSFVATYIWDDVIEIWNGKQHTLSQEELLSLLFAAGLGLVVGIGWRVWRNRYVERDLYKGSVSVISGAIHLDIPDIEKGKNPRGWHLSWQSFYTLEVNGIKFRITKRQWLALLDITHRPICVYYAPHTMGILSIGE